MSSYPVRRGNAHLGLFTQAELNALLASGKLTGTDEAMVSSGRWVSVSAPEFQLPAPPVVPAGLPVQTPASGSPPTSFPSAPAATVEAKRVSLRILLGCALLCSVLAVVLDQSLEHMLPTQLREWRDIDQGVFESLVVVVPGLISLVCWLVGFGGAWFFRKWGANMMLCSTIVMMVLNGLLPSVVPGVAEVFTEAALMLEGAALGLMFLSDVLE